MRPKEWSNIMYVVFEIATANFSNCPKMPMWNHSVSERGHVLKRNNAKSVCVLF